MAIEPEKVALHLVSLIGEAATGSKVDALVTADEFSHWTDELLRRYGCEDHIRMKAQPRTGFFAQAETEPAPKAEGVEKFFLRMELKMAEATYRYLVSPPDPVDPDLLHRFNELAGPRVEASPEFQQGLIDPASSVRRALAIRERLGPGLASVFFAGDDDATSIAMALVAPQYNITAIDIDQRVLDVVDNASRILDVPIHTEICDLRRSVPFHFAGRYDGVVTDPPLNYRATLEFLRFSAGCMRKLDSSRLFLSDHPDWNMGYLDIMDYLSKLGLRCVEVIENLHSYPDPPSVPNDPDAYLDADFPRDEAMTTFFGILDELSLTLELDRRWVRAVAHWSIPWSHLHVLAPVGKSTSESTPRA